MSEIKLTKGQQELSNKLESFLKGPDKFFLIRGKPGVGKTFVIRQVLKDILKEENDSGKMLVAGICLAHQAKNQLRHSVPYVFTFAKAYALTEEFDKRNGERKFVFDKNNKGQIIGKLPLRVFVHDEVSQYTKQMLSIVDENTSFESKVIFIGDKAQLPPIEKNRTKTDLDSPVFEWEWHEENSHVLKERVRQTTGNPILDLSDVIREEIFYNHNIKRVMFNLNQTLINEGLGYTNIEENELFDKMYSLKETSSIIISHTNNRVNSLNKNIRDKFFPNNTSVLVPNDIIYMKENYAKLNEMGYIDYKFENSEFFKIKDTVVFKDVLAIHELREEIEVLVCSLYENPNSFYTPTRMGKLKYNRFMDDLEKKAKKREINWKTFYDYKRRYCEYNYAYAITSYKCQGSTYDNVFVDIYNILGCHALSPKRKLQSIYTAMTRAKYAVYFINQKL